MLKLIFAAAVALLCVVPYVVRKVLRGYQMEDAPGWADLRIDPYSEFVH